MIIKPPIIDEHGNVIRDERFYKVVAMGFSPSEVEYSILNDFKNISLEEAVLIGVIYKTFFSDGKRIYKRRKP